MASRRYLNFDLLLEQEGEGRYQARVTDSPLGETPSVRFELPFDAMGLENLLLKLDPGRSGTRRVGATSQQQAAMDFGGPLYDAVFSGELASAWQRSMDRAGSEEAGLRLRLRLKDAPAIAGLPWELLYDRKTNSFLAQSERTPVVRFLDVPQLLKPLPVDGPLRILAVISSPIGLDELDVEAEWNRLKQALAPRVDAGMVVLDRLPSATLRELGDWLRDHPTHVIHFIGHGDFDDALREGVIYFQDEHGKSTPVTSSVLGPFVRDHVPLRMVVLNACRTARSDGADPFAGMAQGLVQQDATAVVAMQFPISDRAAVAFTGEFYGALVEGLPVDQSVSTARKALLAEFRDEWSTPVLFMRSPDGNIFENVHAATAVTPYQGPPPTPPGPTVLKALALYVRRHVRLVAGAAAALVAVLVGVVFALQMGDDEDPHLVSLPPGGELLPSQLLVAAGPDSASLNVFRFDTADPDAGLVQLTHSDENVKTWLPVLSPDRASVIFSMQRNTNGDFTLWKATSAGDEVDRLFRPTPDECNVHMGRPAWIPTTDDLVMLCVGDVSGARLVRTQGNGVETLLNLANIKLTMVNDPTVSPDGTTLVFWGSEVRGEPRGGAGNLYWLDLGDADGGYEELLGESDGGLHGFSDPVFASKTGMLAFRAIDQDGDLEVFAAPYADHRLDLDGLVQVSDDGDGSDQDPMFSPDGEQLVYSHTPLDDPLTTDVDESDTQALWIASMTGAFTPRQLLGTTDPRYAFQAVPAWSRR